jgi:hypothetical protein
MESPASALLLWHLRVQVALLHGASFLQQQAPVSFLQEQMTW